MDDLKLNVSLLRRRVPNLTTAARSVGLRSATVSNLCTGKIPIGRAEVKTLVALADLAECKVDELLIRSNNAEMLETGIKVIDFFAPIAKGSTVGFVARPGMGQLVVLAEIFHRMKDTNYTRIFLKPENAGAGIQDVEMECDIICKNMKEVRDHMWSLGREKYVLFAADRSTVLSGEMFTLQDELQSAGLMPVTIFLVDPRGEAVDEDEPYGPLDTLWQFDAELVARKMYPAINPNYSASTLLEASHLESVHFAVQQKARKMMRRYRELRHLVDAFGLDHFSQSDILAFERGKRLEAYLTQAFYIAEPVTKLPGTTVSLNETIADVQCILDGSTDDMDAGHLLYIGTLEW